MNRPWLNNYPVRKNLEYPEISLFDFIEQTCDEYPHMIALVFMGNEITFLEMMENIERLAAALHDMGVRKGDRVALMLPNSPQYVYSYYACLKLGAIVVQLNPLYTTAEAEFILKDSGAKVFIGVDAVFDVFNAIRKNVPVEQAVVARILWTDIQGDNKFLEDILNKEYPELPPQAINPREDIAVLQYTGGTTGFPKAAMLTHYNLVANVLQTHEWISPWKDEKFAGGVTQQYGVGALPFFHSFGMTIMNSLLTAPIGQVMVPRLDMDIAGRSLPSYPSFILYNYFSYLALLEAVKEYKPVLFPANPTIYTAILNHPEVNNYGIDAVEICISGSAPMSLQLQKRFAEITGSEILEGYGLSEASPITHVNPYSGSRKACSIGLPYPDVDCKIVDIETGTRELPPGEDGELIVKGPQVMKGYWNRPQETADALRDGWLYTGDIARMDEEGYFFIVDRKKDMIICKGYNVYPKEVDEVLLRHPGIMEAATVGIPDDYHGEVLKAYIVLKKGEEASEEDILEYCKTSMANYKVPRSMVFVKELPKSSFGKILRRKLVEVC